jgi:hypothetical protein
LGVDHDIAQEALGDGVSECDSAVGHGHQGAGGG